MRKVRSAAGKGRSKGRVSRVRRRRSAQGSAVQERSRRVQKRSRDVQGWIAIAEALAAPQRPPKRRPWPWLEPVCLALAFLLPAAASTGLAYALHRSLPEREAEAIVAAAPVQPAAPAPVASAADDVIVP